MKPMRPQFVLTINNQGACLHDFARPQNSPVSLASIKQAKIILDIIKQYPDTPITILADTMAQDLRRETLPPVGFLDRRKIIARRIQSITAPLVGALPIQGDKNSILLASIQEESPIISWLEKLSTETAHPVGVCFLALEGAGIAGQIISQSHTEWVLTISLQNNGDLRQIVTHKNALILSRVTPMQPNLSIPEQTTIIHNEIGACRDYLRRLGLHDHLPYHVLAMMPQNYHLALRGIMGEGMTITLITPYDVARNMRLPITNMDEKMVSDRLYTNWFAHNKKPALCLMQKQARALHHHIRVRQMGWWLVLCVLLVVFLSLLGQGQRFFTLGMKLGNQQAEISTLYAQIAQAQAEMPSSSMTSAELSLAMARMQGMRKPIMTPWMTLETIAQAIPSSLHLSRLHWQHKAHEEITQFDVAPHQESSPEEVAESLKVFARQLSPPLSPYLVRITHSPFALSAHDTLSSPMKNQESAPIFASFEIRKNKP